MDYYCTLDDELAAVLWDDIPYINNNDNNNNNSISLQNYNNSNDHSNTSTTILSCDSSVIGNNNSMSYEHTYTFNDRDHQQQINQETVVSVGKQKRKREAHQIQHHIIAERKRRQLLTQRFIALSAIVPGLKKMDKTSVLGEAIKYLKQLQEKVKTLEEEQTAKRTIESTSVMVVKKSKHRVDDDNNNDINGVDDNDDSLCSSVADNSGTNGDSNALYPEIEVKLSGQTLLFKFHYEKHRGVLVKLFQEIERHNLRVDNCCIIPFGSLALDVTIVTQMEKGSDNNVKEIVKALHSVLRY